MKNRYDGQVKLDIKSYLLPASPDVADIAKAVDFYKYLTLENMKILVDRYEQQSNYKWADMKFDVQSGHNFDADDNIRGYDRVYMWIQGRALESIAGHIYWFNSDVFDGAYKNLADKSSKIVAALLEQSLNVLQKNNGRLSFVMNTEGKPLCYDNSGKFVPTELAHDRPYNFSDLFMAKGSYAAADYLKQSDIAADKYEYCINLTKAVLDGNFASDQIRFDIANPVSNRPNIQSFGPLMIQLGAMSLLMDSNPDNRVFELGMSLINKIMANHLNINQKWHAFSPFDMVEFIDNNGNPFIDNGVVLSNSGHALEFAGFAAKFLWLSCNKGFISINDKQFLKWRDCILSLVIQNFNNGYCRPFGICSTFDLVKRSAVNSVMPWWSLPESIRAAAYCCYFAEENEKVKYRQIIADCHNSYINYYVQAQSNFMALQSIGTDGKKTAAIPAVPDIDPCYHTGLSLIDACKVLS